MQFKKKHWVRTMAVTALAWVAVTATTSSGFRPSSSSTSKIFGRKDGLSRRQRRGGTPLRLLSSFQSQQQQTSPLLPPMHQDQEERQSHGATTFLVPKLGSNNNNVNETTTTALESSDNPPALPSLSQDDKDRRQPNKQKRGIALALSLTYFAVMGAKCALPSVLPLLVATDGTGLEFPVHGPSPQACMAQLLYVSTLAVAAGKLLLGPAIDYWGGRTSLQVALVLLMTLLGYLAAFNQSFAGFFVAWVGVDFIFSSCWAASINAIHQFFPPDRWGVLIGNLATGARAGNALAFLCFGQVLQFCASSSSAAAGWMTQQPWRMVFALSAAFQLLPLSLLFWFCRSDRAEDDGASSAKQQQPPPSSSPCLSTTWKIALQESQTLDFWLHFVSRSVLMVFASFLLFVPTLLSQVYHTSAAYASQTGSIYALGCLVAVSCGARPFAALTKRRDKLLAVLGLLGSAVAASAAQLAHVSHRITLSPVGASVCFFIWGAAMALPFYIPPSLYALRRGGTECSATIADLFDIGGFGLLATFNGYVAGLAGTTNPAAWIPTFQATTLCALTSLVTLGIATWREERPSSEA